MYPGPQRRVATFEKAGPDTPERFTESRQVAEHERPKLMLLIPQKLGLFRNSGLEGIPMIW